MIPPADASTWPGCANTSISKHRVLILNCVRQQARLVDKMYFMGSVLSCVLIWFRETCWFWVLKKQTKTFALEFVYLDHKRFLQCRKHGAKCEIDFLLTQNSQSQSTNKSDLNFVPHPLPTSAAAGPAQFLLTIHASLDVTPGLICGCYVVIIIAHRSPRLYCIDSCSLVASKSFTWDTTQQLPEP